MRSGQVRTLDHLGADLEMAERKVPPPQDDVEEVPVISGPRERQALGEIGWTTRRGRKSGTGIAAEPFHAPPGTPVTSGQPHYTTN
jgi:hypothetical protein